jgi:hypothetical protein
MHLEENLLRAGESFSYLFNVKATELFYAKLEEQFQIGNFELSWRRTNCEKGSILTVPLKSSVSHRYQCDKLTFF